MAERLDPAAESDASGRAVARSAPPAAPVRVGHVISGLGAGGAERTLVKLVTALAPHGFEAEVLSLTPGGRLSDELRAAGVRVYAPSRTGIAALTSALAAVGRDWRRRPPHLVQGWMAHGNLVASALAAAVLPGRRPALWNVRQAVYSLDYETRGTARLIRLLGRLSRSPSRIVFNADVAVRQHAALGYDTARAVVVPNGFDTVRFRPDPDARLAARRAWAVEDGDLVVGMVARVHRQKDHPTFLRALAHAAERGVRVIGVAVGQGASTEDGELRSLAAGLGLGGRLRLLGDRRDVAALYPGFDVACLSSITEGFPNVLGEAMACGVPCVATDVGATAELVGDSGRVAPVGDPAALGAAIVELDALGGAGRAALGRRARARIVADFSLDAVAERFARLYLEVLSGAAQR
jgi:glycosyltransferase involved in cell wall biosynthesis